MFRDVTHEELEASLQTSGFSLPSEDEWEYLAGCGARTLWHFGDEPDPNEVALPHEKQPKNPKFSLFEPNLFGPSRQARAYRSMARWQARVTFPPESSMRVSSCARRRVAMCRRAGAAPSGPPRSAGKDSRPSRNLSMLRA